MQGSDFIVIEVYKLEDWMFWDLSISFREEYYFIFRLDWNGILKQSRCNGVMGEVRFYCLNCLFI